MDPDETIYSGFEIKKDLTILLLGETGVGKSTWINAFANILQYDTMEVATASPSLHVIPTYFTITNDDYEEFEVRVGSDENECSIAGQSATQSPKTYIFTQNGYKIRLIDTPGIGDVRGIQRDKKNFQLILDHISHLHSIDGICVLLKPNNARLNVIFSFCIKELLTHLHLDACKNIVFCFTNARSTFYRPGDTLPALKNLLADNECSNIKLNRSTIYCIDNESIRFLYAMQEQIQFSNEEYQNYEQSWQKSAQEINRMLGHFSNLIPHKVKDTLSLNDVRHMILGSSKPLIDISHNIQLNIALAQQHLTNLRQSECKAEDLSNALHRKKIDIRQNPFSEPRTACANAKCVESVKIDAGGITLAYPRYKQFCHDKCSRGKKKHYEIIGVVGHKSLRKCSAFRNRKTPENCSFCGCSWKWHVKMVSDTIVDVTETLDWEKKQMLENQEESIGLQRQILMDLECELEELKSEQDEIRSATAKFACFLIKNSIRPYNDSVVNYLDHLIDKEESNIKRGGDDSVVKGLIEMKKGYEEDIRVIQNAISMGNADSVSPTEINLCLNRLFELKHNGSKLKEIMETHLHTSEDQVYNEKKIVSKRETRKSRKKSQKVPSPIYDEPNNQNLLNQPHSRNTDGKFDTQSNKKPSGFPGFSAFKATFFDGVSDVKRLLKPAESNSYANSSFVNDEEPIYSNAGLPHGPGQSLLKSQSLYQPCTSQETTRNYNLRQYERENNSQTQLPRNIAIENHSSQESASSHQETLLAPRNIVSAIGNLYGPTEEFQAHFSNDMNREPRDHCLIDRINIPGVTADHTFV